MKDISIALVIPDFDYGGEEKRVVFFANSYLKYYRSVYLIAPSGQSDKLLESGIKRIVLDVRNPIMIPVLLKRLKKEGIDVLQGHKRASLIYLFLAERLLGIKSFFNFDNIYLNHNKLCGFIAPSRNVYLSDVLRDFYLPFLPKKNNITINMGGEFLRKYSKEVRLNLRHELGIPDDTIVIISLGRLATQKNHSLLLNSLSKLIHKDFICFIVGSGPLDSDLKNQCNLLGLTPFVKFLGHRTDIEELLNISDFLVQTSIFEGFPNVFIEAVSVGLPIVSTDVGSARTLVKGNGILVPSQDVEKLTEAISLVIENLNRFQNFAEEMIESAYFKKFSKEVMLSSYVSYINKLDVSGESKGLGDDY